MKLAKMATMDQKPNRIAEHRLARRMSQADLANAVGAHKITISKLERGEMRLTQDWMERLAKALDVRAIDIFQDPSMIYPIFVNGIIRDNIDLNPEKSANSAEAFTPVRFEIDFGPRLWHTSFYLIVATNIFQPIIHNGDIVRFSGWEKGVQQGGEAKFGRLVIGETDYPYCSYIGILERGSNDAIFDIRHPISGYKRGLRLDRIYAMDLVLAQPQHTLIEGAV